MPIPMVDMKTGRKLNRSTKKGFNMQTNRCPNQSEVVEVDIYCTYLTHPPASFSAFSCLPRALKKAPKEASKEAERGSTSN